MSGFFAFVRQHVVLAIFITLGGAMNIYGFISSAYDLARAGLPATVWEGIGAALFFVSIIVLVYRISATKSTVTVDGQTNVNDPLIWGALTEGEIENIMGRLKDVTKNPISIYHEPHGAKLADSIFRLFSRQFLDWKVRFDTTNMSVPGGITIYPDNEKTRAIADAIRLGTKGKIRPKIEKSNDFYFGGRCGDYPNDLVMGYIDIAIGTKP